MGIENLAKIIEYLYPRAITLIDFEVTKSGGKIYISKWNEDKLGTKPTINYLLSKEQEYLDSSEQDKSELNNEITKIKTFFKENNLSIRALKEIING